ncbi:MAG: RNA polymerase sigma factor [Nannocystaceae bacterium]|nr:RNA polymerase sigma factor [Nannocystaceae bacterium]
MARAKSAASEASDGFRAFFRAHYAFVWRSVRRCGVPLADLDDVVQEVFMVAFGERDRFEGRSSLKTWLYGVAVNRARMSHRSQARRRKRHEAGGAGVIAGPASDLESRHAAVDLLDRLVSTLDPDKRDVFVLVELEDVPASDVAAQLGVSVNTVHSRLRLARKRITIEVRRMRARRQRETA